MTGRDWRDMTPRDFNDRAETVQTALLPAPDPCGTGDLLAELEDEAPMP